MKFNITGRNIDVTPSLKAMIEKKLGRLDRLFRPDTVAHITLSVTKDRHTIEVTIPMKGSVIRTEQTSSDMYVSLDLALEVIEKQLRRYKTKLMNRRQANLDAFNAEFLEEEIAEEEGHDITIVRSKRFGIKPMSPEEACVQMELLGHAFYVFQNGHTNEVNVVYRRKNGQYGLIEPALE